MFMTIFYLDLEVTGFEKPLFCELQGIHTEDLTHPPLTKNLCPPGYTWRHAPPTPILRVEQFSLQSAGLKKPFVLKKKKVISFQLKPSLKQSFQRD